MKRSNVVIPSLLLSLLAGAVLVGCSLDPSEPVESEKAAPLPTSLKELNALADTGAITRVTPEAIASADRAYVARVTAAERSIREAAATASPAESKRLLNTIVLASDVERTDDGNYRVMVADSEVGEREIITMGADITKLDLASALAGRASAEEQLTAYRALHDGIAPTARGRLGAISPDALTTAQPDVIRAEIARLSAHPDLLSSLLVPAPEEHPLATADNSGNVCNPSAATGVIANFNFPLKSKLTSIKNQGNRGTCASFAITAAVEAARAVNGGGSLNFSEQDFYYRNKAQWFGLINYGDGLDVASALNMANSQSYHFASEGAWPYNPASSRLDLSSIYLNSCVGYQFSVGGAVSNYCSDTAHEGGQLCVGGTCFYSSPVSAGTGSRVSSTFNLPLDLVTLKANLMLSKAIVMSFSVPVSFKTPAAGGYVNALAFEPTVGAHALQVVGWIDNNQLTTTRPGAPAGGGGGYLILKNSWGSCFADGGFVYMSYNTMTAFAYALRVLDVVN
jgi:hypothetical protein